MASDTHDCSQRRSNRSNVLITAARCLSLRCFDSSIFAGSRSDPRRFSCSARARPTRSASSGSESWSMSRATHPADSF